MKSLDKAMAQSITMVCAILGIAAALSGCGSRTGSSAGNVGSQATGSAGQTDAHVPPAAVAGQAQYARQQQASAQIYAELMKRQMAQQHKK